MKTKNLISERKQVYKLIKKGDLTQKQIAEKLGISEVTISKWAKGLKNELLKLITVRKKIIQRLNEALENPESKSTDIHNYTTSLSVVAKQIENLDKYLIE